MELSPPPQDSPRWRKALYTVIFEADTPAGKWFDVVLIASIAASVLTVMLDSVESIHDRWGPALYGVEWFFTLLFTAEYVLRLLCVGSRVRYARSFFGLVDLLAVAPTYLSLLAPKTHYLLVIRVLRVLRVFRVLKLAKHLVEADLIMRALYASRQKITVFLFGVLTIVILVGSFMYLIEGPDNGFTSIPQSIFWTVVTITTVGYGDITPQTVAGKTLAAFIMILGYGIIAVPTGIVTVEFSRADRRGARRCPRCATNDHDADATFCKSCGAKLNSTSETQ